MPGTFSSQFLGMDKLKEAIDKLGDRGDQAARESVTIAAQVVEAEIKAQFAGAHPRNQAHVGGDKPNVVSGRLRASVHADPVAKIGKDTWGTFVGPRMVYGRRVELGYRGSRGYPYTRPGFEKAKPKIAAAQSNVVRRYLLGG